MTLFPRLPGRHMITVSEHITSLLLRRFAKFVEASPKYQPIVSWTGCSPCSQCTWGILYVIDKRRNSAITWLANLSGGSGMKRTSRTIATLSFVGCLFGASLGCQTWVGGMTLPSPDYLKDKPDYIQPAPLYKHSKELASMQKAMAEANPEMNKYPVRNVQPPAPAPLQNPAAPSMPAPAVPAPANPVGQ